MEDQDYTLDADVAIQAREDAERQYYYNYNAGPTQTLGYAGGGAACGVTKTEAGYAGYRCSKLQHYFECSHAQACNCGKVILKEVKVEGCL